MKTTVSGVIAIVLAGCAGGGQGSTSRDGVADAVAPGVDAGSEASAPGPQSGSGPQSGGGLEDASPSTPNNAKEAGAAEVGGYDAAPEGSTGCPGVPIVPDANGYVAPNSNSVGIHGSFFIYSDCNDLGGKNCADVTSPTGTGAFPNVGGKICTSGTNSTAANAWGAGVGLELNDGPPQQPYDTVAHGVTGFCFNLSGPTIPSTTVRVAFPTQDNNDNAYFESVSTVGINSVLFSDIKQGSWVTSPSPWEPTKVMLMQFQIPASTATPVAWDFCIDSLTAIVR